MGSSPTRPTNLPPPAATQACAYPQEALQRFSDWPGLASPGEEAEKVGAAGSLRKDPQKEPTRGTSPSSARRGIRREPGEDPQRSRQNSIKPSVTTSG